MSVDQRNLDQAAPMTFPALMEMYEQNYLLLRVLCGCVPECPAKSLSVIEGPGKDLHVTVIDATPYTRTLKLTYDFGRGEYKPDLIVRMYMDAQQAEVLSRRCRFTGAMQRVGNEVDDSALYCRWKLNRFLFKWLHYLRRQGHGFDGAQWTPLG